MAGNLKIQVFFKKTGLFFIYFRLSEHTLHILQQNICEKCPSSIWCRDSNSQPLELESPPITTRPGLPPHKFVCHFLTEKLDSTLGNGNSYAIPVANVINAVRL